MNHSAAQIISSLLITKGIFDTPSKSSNFPLFISHLPSAKDVVQAGVISDTEGLLEGRMMSGILVLHPGLQIRVRSADYSTAFQKMESISQAFSLIKNEQVEMEDHTLYVINNLSQMSSILSMGVEPDTKLFLFSINFITTITQKEGTKNMFSKTVTKRRMKNG